MDADEYNPYAQSDEPIVIEVGEFDDAEELAAALNDNEGQLLSEVAYRDCQSHHGDRGEVHSSHVNKVEFFRDAHDTPWVSIDFDYTWSAHYGCKDMNDAGDENVHIEAAYADGYIRVPGIHKRTTHNEF